MQNKWLNILIVMLVVAAVGMGIAIFAKVYGPNRAGTTTERGTSPQTQTQPVDGSNTQTATQDTTQQASLTDEEKQVLSFPGPNATEAEKKAHSDLVNKLGNESGFAYLDISGCKPKPIIYRVKLGGSFKVKNADSTNHTIYTDRKTTIKANSELTLESKAIGDNLGNYGYGCDGSAGSGVGIIQIIP